MKAAEGLAKFSAMIHAWIGEKTMDAYTKKLFQSKLPSLILDGLVIAAGFIVKLFASSN